MKLKISLGCTGKEQEKVTKWYKFEALLELAFGETGLEGFVK
jgi:hypothetical protein